MGHTDLTWRRIAAIRELATLGQKPRDIARLLGMNISTVYVMASRYDISFLALREESAFHRAIREGYAAGKSPKEIADETGSKRNSVAVIACRMGLTKHTLRDPAKHRRGFSVPHEMREEYRSVQRKVRSAKEAGIILGLLERPAL